MPRIAHKLRRTAVFDDTRYYLLVNEDDFETLYKGLYHRDEVEWTGEWNGPGVYGEYVTRWPDSGEPKSVLVSRVGYKQLERMQRSCRDMLRLIDVFEKANWVMEWNEFEEDDPDLLIRFQHDVLEILEEMGPDVMREFRERYDDKRNSR